MHNKVTVTTFVMALIGVLVAIWFFFLRDRD